MPNSFFTTIEDQLRSDGSHGLLYDHFDDKCQAESKFHYICAAAAISDIPFHAAYLIDSNVGLIEQRVWDRREQE